MRITGFLNMLLCLCFILLSPKFHASTSSVNEKANLSQIIIEMLMTGFLMMQLK